MRRLRLCTIVCLLALFVTACNGAEVETDDPTPPDTIEQEPQADDPQADDPQPGEPQPDEPALLGLIDDMIDAGLHPPREREYPAVLDRLPEPERIEEEPHENRHVPGQIDTLRTYYYEGVEYELYDVSDSEQIIAQELTLTNPQYRTEEGLRVGMTREEVEEIMGAPDEQENGRYQYHIDTLPDEPIEGPPNYLYVDFDNDQVTQLQWSFYVD